VRTCSDYQDDIGHLTSSGAQAVGASVAQWWAQNDAQVSAPTPTPTSSPTPTAVPPTNTPTPTPRPTNTATTTPTPTPTSGGSFGRQTVTFDDLSNPQRPLNGQYPTAVIDWGTGQWWLSGPTGKFTTNSVSFNGPVLTTAAFNFVTPRQLVQLDVYNRGLTSTTISIACTGEVTKEETLAPGQVTTITTGWTGPCTTVTISSTNGWNTNFDNLVIDLGLPV
jgi:hypothetical protein